MHGRTSWGREKVRSPRDAVQFAFMVVDKKQGWANNFEEVVIVTHGSYFGDI